MTEDKATPASSGSILVVGGGISGLTTALEAAEVGYEVFLVEKKSLSGRTGSATQSILSQAMPSDLRA
jgi:quinone-modifying oxidoreductase subunit QmoA